VDLPAQQPSTANYGYAFRDGQLANKFLSLSVALRSQGYPTQETTDAIVAANAWQLSIDAGQTAILTSGMSTATFCGSATDAGFVATPPERQAMTDALQLPLPFALSQAIPLNAVHVQWAVQSDGGLAGQLNALVFERDMDVVVDALAAAANTQPANPDFAILDTGCGGFFPGLAGDGVIEPCEISTNMFIKGALRPDVSWFSDPQTPDSWSIGFGFSAQPR
jgi:hypothetical protein